MFLTLSKRSVALRGASDPTIEALVNLVPDFSAGKTVHDLYVNKAMAVLPGDFKQLFKSSRSYRSIFYPNWSPAAFIDNVTGDTGLNDDWWREFSIALLCQTFAAVGSHIPKYLKTGDIDGSVRSHNDTLKQSSAILYARVLAATYTPLANILRGLDPAVARPMFRQSLIDNVLTRQIWYVAGQWTNPDWEVFNQYAKYLALGASAADVDSLADALVAAGLPMPSLTDRANWRRYSEEFRLAPDLGSDDFRAAASPAIVATLYIPTYGEGGAAEDPEGYCFDFTANDRPGNGFRTSPSSCCFDGSTQVLDATGRPISLRDVKPGDRIATEHAAGTVAFVARPQRADRPLFTFEPGGPVFTDTHPFLNAAWASDQDPRLLAVAPERLRVTIPTLAGSGIAPIAGGTLACRSPTTSARPVATPPVTRAATRHDDDGFLFDISLVCDTGEPQTYWAGSGETFYLVAPEFPVIDAAAEWAPAVVAIMEGLHASGVPSLPGITPMLALEMLTAALAHYAPRIYLGSLTKVLEAGVPDTPAAGPLLPRINALFAAIAGEDVISNSMFSTIFDTMLASCGEWLAASVALGWREFRRLGGDVLVLTIFDMALGADTPIPPETTVKLDVTVGGRHSTETAPMWDRQGRTNTRFHHYFDQLLHYDLSAGASAEEIVFAACVDGAPIPALYGRVPLLSTDATNFAMRSAPMLDCCGTTIGTINFDVRRMSADAAAAELALRPNWLPTNGAAFAEALGTAMVEPIRRTLIAILAPQGPVEIRAGA